LEAGGVSQVKSGEQQNRGYRIQHRGQDHAQRAELTAVLSQDAVQIGDGLRIAWCLLDMVNNFLSDYMGNASIF